MSEYDIGDVGVDDFPDDGSQGSAPATITYVNEAGVSEEVALEAVRRSDAASAIERWSRQLNLEASGGPTSDIFNRGGLATARNPFHLQAQLIDAVEGDDILSTLADVLEGLAFQKCHFEAYDADQEDVWNQWAATVDLDARLREMFRELYKVSQVYVGLWWERKEFRVRDRRTEQELQVLQGEGPGRGNHRRKKTYSVLCPTAITLFSPLKVVPVGNLAFGRERFAYIADRGEDGAFGEVLGGDAVDDTVLRLIERKYVPNEAERKLLTSWDIEPDRLWLFRRESVFRHSLTRAQYERFPAFRLKPTLEILDMKHHLRASDRAALVGNTNFIVVIKKGTDKLPAKAAEIANLQEQARVVARMPILVGDHRLSVEIVAPPLDNTLQQSRWEVLDSRLVFKALQSFMPIVQGNNSTGVSEMSRVVSRGIENRRHSLRRSIEAEILRRTVERNEELDEVPSLTYTPKRVALDFNQHVVQAVLKLRDRGDLSRETMLEEVDFDQDVEFRRRARERRVYDEVFQSQVPHSSPTSNPFTTGSQGGRPPGAQDEEPRQRGQGEGE